MKWRRLGFTLFVPVALGMLSSSPADAQNKSACELLSKSDAEAILGVPLLPPQPSAPFRSLLDPDFTSGTPEQGCRFTNYGNSQSKPSKLVSVRLEVRYASTPDTHAIDETRHQVDTRTYDHPTDLPGLGNAAFWTGPPNNVTVFVFLGGTTRLMVGPSEVGLDAEKAIAAKAVAALGKATFAYGTAPTGLTKPVLGKAGPSESGIEQLKRALTTKADAGDARAQRALGRLYQYGTVNSDGSAQPDYSGAAYWYLQASDHGDAEAAYRLAILYQKGLGVAADAAQSFHLLQKAAEANYVPAMPLLSDVYADQKTPVSGERATYWATKAAEVGDARGWLALGFEYNMGKLGGDPPYWRIKALESYTKAAGGGNCLAMMAIADLYAKEGATDPGQVKSWQAKAQSCQGGNTAMLQQQVARFKARAAAARDPALNTVLAALPNITNPPTQAAGINSRLPAQGRSTDASGFNRSILVGLVAAAAVVTAAAMVAPNTPGNAASDSNYDAQAAMADMSRCYRVSSSGLNPNLYGC
ncbi:MAG TPA: tetratricopeptide repeat protein [Steroidobacteraceae bacterium]